MDSSVFLNDFFLKDASMNEALMPFTDTLFVQRVYPTHRKKRGSFYIQLFRRLHNMRNN
jgi:hypothetical protein